MDSMFVSMLKYHENRLDIHKNMVLTEYNSSFDYCTLEVDLIDLGNVIRFLPLVVTKYPNRLTSGQKLDSDYAFAITSFNNSNNIFYSSMETLIYNKH